MRYFKHKKSGEVFGYDETDETQIQLINDCLASPKVFVEVTGAWPPIKIEAELLEEWRASATCTPRQLRLALNAVGLRDEVEEAVASASRDIKDMWDYSLVFERFDPILNSMANGLGMSDAQLDDIFKLAQTK